jgi:hypothetical protein
VEDRPVHADVVHLGHHQLRRCVERRQSGRQVLGGVVDTLRRPPEFPEPASSKVDLGQAVHGRVATVPQGLLRDGVSVRDAAHRLVVEPEQVLDVAHMLGSGAVAGRAAHGREDVGMGVGDHLRAPRVVTGR